MNGKISATSHIQSYIRLSAQNDSCCHGSQIECLRDYVRIPKTKGVFLLLNRNILEESWCVYLPLWMDDVYNLGLKPTQLWAPSISSYLDCDDTTLLLFIQLTCTRGHIQVLVDSGCNSNLNSRSCSLESPAAKRLSAELCSTHEMFWPRAEETNASRCFRMRAIVCRASLITNTQSFLINKNRFVSRSPHNLSRLGRDVSCQIIRIIVDDVLLFIAEHLPFLSHILLHIKKGDLFQWWSHWLHPQACFVSIYQKNTMSKVIRRSVPLGKLKLLDNNCDWFVCLKCVTLNCCCWLDVASTDVTAMSLASR